MKTKLIVDTKKPAEKSKHECQPLRDLTVKQAEKVKGGALTFGRAKIKVTSRSL